MLLGFFCICWRWSTCGNFFVLCIETCEHFNQISKSEHFSLNAQMFLFIFEIKRIFGEPWKFYGTFFSIPRSPLLMPVDKQKQNN